MLTTLVRALPRGRHSFEDERTLHEDHGPEASAFPPPGAHGTRGRRGSLRVVSCATVVLVALLDGAASLGCGGVTGPDKFVDSWREPGHRPPYVMRIDAPRGGVYRVTYRRFYPASGEFSFSDGRLVYSPVSPALTDVITYDASTDSITITGGGSGPASP